MEYSVNQRKKNLPAATYPVPGTGSNELNPHTQAVNLLTLFNVLARKSNPLQPGIKPRWWYRLFGKQTTHDEIDEDELLGAITPEELQKIWPVIFEASPLKKGERCAVGGLNQLKELISMMEQDISLGQEGQQEPNTESPNEHISTHWLPYNIDSMMMVDEASIVSLKSIALTETQAENFHGANTHQDQPNLKADISVQTTIDSDNSSLFIGQTANEPESESDSGPESQQLSEMESVYETPVVGDERDFAAAILMAIQRRHDATSYNNRWRRRGFEVSRR
ncbi:unnamed protein product [Ambrosiozyma monospora]|uniref:Unnamed protein product n=1 Tax=Ambrosiozyma monospora TaxID=43982 RepID=A0A9W7DFL7_AMBMO|nr:unnamed protein product [Ambrosiozyma monospora]